MSEIDILAREISAPLADSDMEILAELWGTIRRHRPDNLLRASYYDGKRAVKQLGTIIPPMYHRLGAVLGWSAKAVDLLGRRCRVESFVWPDGDVDEVGVSAIWESNNLAALLRQAFVSSLIYGTSFLVTDRRDGQPVIRVKDALSATARINNDTGRTDAALTIQQFAENVPTRFALHLPGRTVTCVHVDGDWSVSEVQHDLGVPVEPLVYKPLPGREYGYSRITPVTMGLQDLATRAMIRSEAQGDVYAFPQMFLLGADSSIFKDASGNTLPSWRVALGRYFGIPDDDEATNPRVDVKQFQSPSQQPHMDQLQTYAELFSGETSIPVTSLGVSSEKANPTSAESYLASREDLISEAEGATDEWAPGLRRSMATALQIRHGLDAPRDEWMTVGPKFRSPVYTSRAAMADAGSKQIAAIPWLAETEVGLELAGLTDQQIKRALGERRRVRSDGILRALGVGDDAGTVG